MSEKKNKCMRMFHFKRLIFVWSHFHSRSIMFNSETAKLCINYYSNEILSILFVNNSKLKHHISVLSIYDSLIEILQFLISIDRFY